MRLGIGTAQFGMAYGITNTDGQVSIENIKEIMSFARKSDINMLDSAPDYGISEKILGEMNVYGNGFDIVTKVSSIPLCDTDISEHVRTNVLNSLECIKCESLYGLLIHDSKNLIGKRGDEVWSVLEKLKDEGVVKKIGVSVYDKNELKKIMEKYPLDIVQVPINIFDQRMLAGEFLKNVKVHGIEIHARSVFLQGLVLTKVENIPKRIKKHKEKIETFNKKLIKQFITPIQAAISFILAQKEIDYFFVGVTEVNQLKEIIDILKNPNFIDFSEFSINDENFIDPRCW